MLGILIFRSEKVHSRSNGPGRAQLLLKTIPVEMFGAHGPKNLHSNSNRARLGRAWPITVTMCLFATYYIPSKTGGHVAALEACSLKLAQPRTGRSRAPPPNRLKGGPVVGSPAVLKVKLKNKKSPPPPLGSLLLSAVSLRGSFSF